jgi:hypothetical protein
VTLREWPDIVFQAKRGYKAKVRDFEPFWRENYENKAFKLIEKYTGLQWRRLASHIEVVARQPNENEKVFAALTDIPRRPDSISLFDVKSNESLSKDLIHELIHSIMWSTYLRDQRTKKIGLFDDIFADELLSELISQKIYIRLRLSKKMDYRGALQYGFETALEKIADILGVKSDTWKLDKDARKSSAAAKNLRKDMLKKLEKWFREYLRNVEMGTTNALKAVNEIANLFSNIIENQ